MVLFNLCVLETLVHYLEVYVNKKEFLFTGELLRPKGLSNEGTLAIECPQEFFDPDNPWSSCAASYILKGRTDLRGWKWKTNDQQTRIQQVLRLEEIVSGSSLDADHQRAVAGWMLSEMLRQVPKYAR